MFYKTSLTLKTFNICLTYIIISNVYRIDIQLKYAIYTC